MKLDNFNYILNFSTKINDSDLFDLMQFESFTIRIINLFMVVK